MKTLIYGGHVVNEGKILKANVIADNGVITDITESNEGTPCGNYDETVDATGCFVIPGVIDTHVHFREPGMTAKADMESESRAAAWGGVTTIFDMPNTVPQTVTDAALDAKLALAAEKCHVNYAFYIGATNTNIEEIANIDVHKVPGVKLFMGASTGNMLVDREDVLAQLFARSPLPIMAHCEDMAVINANMAKIKHTCGSDPDVVMHPKIRSAEACFNSASLAVKLAKEKGAHLHVAHVSTEDELKLFGDSADITAEAVVAHLIFDDSDYSSLGTLIKCNPAIKTRCDREALRKALSAGNITTVATDHAPHKLSDKHGGCVNAASGMPMIQFSLVSMLGLVDDGYITIERMVELMCHNPARLFQVNRRGFLRKGYKADLAVVQRSEPWTVTKETIQSKCAWSPLEGREFAWKVRQTICNGHVVYDNGMFDVTCHGEQVTFR